VVFGAVVGTLSYSFLFCDASAESTTQEVSPIPPTFRFGSPVLAVNLTTHELYDGRHTVFQILIYDNETKEPIKYATFWLNITEITNINEKVIFTELFRSETGKPINLDIVNINDIRNRSVRGATFDRFTDAIMSNNDSNDASIAIMTSFITHTGNYKISFVVIGAEYPRPSFIDHPYRMNYYWDGQSDDLRQIKIVPEFGSSSTIADIPALVLIIGVLGVLGITKAIKHTS